MERPPSPKPPPSTELRASARSTSKRRALSSTPRNLFQSGFYEPAPEFAEGDRPPPKEILWVNSLQKNCSGGNSIKNPDRTSENPGDPRPSAAGERQGEPPSDCPVIPPPGESRPPVNPNPPRDIFLGEPSLADPTPGAAGCERREEATPDIVAELACRDDMLSGAGKILRDTVTEVLRHGDAMLRTFEKLKSRKFAADDSSSDPSEALQPFTEISSAGERKNESESARPDPDSKHPDHLVRLWFALRCKLPKL